MARTVWLMTVAWMSLSAVTSLLVCWFSGWTLLHVYTPLAYVCIAVFWSSALVIPVVTIISLWAAASGRMSVKGLGAISLVNLFTVAIHVGAMVVESTRYY